MEIQILGGETHCRHNERLVVMHLQLSGDGKEENVINMRLITVSLKMQHFMSGFMGCCIMKSLPPVPLPGRMCQQKEKAGSMRAILQQFHYSGLSLNDSDGFVFQNRYGCPRPPTSVTPIQEIVSPRWFSSRSYILWERQQSVSLGWMQQHKHHSVLPVRVWPGELREGPEVIPWMKGQNCSSILTSPKHKSNPGPPLIRAINPERGESARGAAGKRRRWKGQQQMGSWCSRAELLSLNVLIRSLNVHHKGLRMILYHAGIHSRLLLKKIVFTNC